jgi:hypothetical protein
MLVRWFAKRSLKWVPVAGDGDASCEQEVDEG